jgi:hypothetical protein
MRRRPDWLAVSRRYLVTVMMGYSCLAVSKLCTTTTTPAKSVAAAGSLQGRFAALTGIDTPME